MTDTTGYNIRPMIAALIEAGLISDTRTVTRVVMDIRADLSPAVYVQYEGDPDKICAITQALAESMPIVETSSAEPSVDASTYIVDSRMSADGRFHIPPGARFQRLADVQPPPATHRENALGYARAVELQRQREIDDELLADPACTEGADCPVASHVSDANGCRMVTG